VIQPVNGVGLSHSCQRWQRNLARSLFDSCEYFVYSTLEILLCNCVTQSLFSLSLAQHTDDINLATECNLSSLFLDFIHGINVLLYSRLCVHRSIQGVRCSQNNTSFQSCCPSSAFLPVHNHKVPMPDKTDAKKILTASPLENWRKPPGCPCTTWIKTIQQDLKSNNLSLNETTDEAQNRPLWRLMSTFSAMHS